MLLDMLKLQTAYMTVGLIAVWGAFVKLLIGSIYKRDIRNARNIEHTKKSWLQRMKRNFDKTFGDGLIRDTDLFVENEMSSRGICGIPIKSLDEFFNQLPLVVLTATVAFDCIFVGKAEQGAEIVSFTLFGATVCLAIHTFNMIVNNDIKAGRLKVILTQYFSNEKLPFILMNQYADEGMIAQKNVSSDKKLPAEIKETGTTALVALTKEESAKKEVMESARARRKKLKAEKLKIKRLMKQRKKDERADRKKTREMLKQQAIKNEYDEKMKKLQEKYQMESRKEPEGNSLNMAFAAATEASGEMRARTHRSQSERQMESLNRTLKDAFPETKQSEDDEKLIEEVLKEYLFR